MPNAENILRPMVLISYGRSGTSLIGAAFDARGDCFYCGETANLITKTWTGVELSQAFSLINVSADIVSAAEPCSMAVRAVFLSLFPSEKPFWFQKPIGITTELDERIRTLGEDAAIDWYWTVLARTFPDAKFFTILRNPYDVFISAKAFWNMQDKEIWDGMRIIANLIIHPKSRIEYAISFHGLIGAFDEEMLHLCSHLNLPYSAAMKSATEFRHAPSQLGESSQKFGYNGLWHEVRVDLHVEQSINSIERVWHRFGQQFERRTHPTRSSARQ